MAGLREQFRPLADELRAIAGPSGLGVRTNQLTVRTRTWAGSRPGDPTGAVHLYPSTLRVTAPVATDVTSATALANALLAAYVAHAANSAAHAVADTADAVTAPAATDQPSAILLANNLKAEWNLHVANATVHFTADGADAVATADASNPATLVALVNAERTAWNAHFALSAVTDSDLVLPMNYRIRQLDQHEIVQSGGRYENGDIIVEHITPFDGISVGYTVSQLKPAATSNKVQIIYLITTDDPAGGHTGEYDLRELRSWRAFSFDLILYRKETQPNA